MLGAVGGAIVGFGLYALNVSRSQQDFNTGDALLAAGVGALAGAALVAAPIALAEGAITAGAALTISSAGLGAAGNGGGYMVKNALLREDFDSTEFGVASATGAINGALGPHLGSTWYGATLLGAGTGVLQHEATAIVQTGSPDSDFNNIGAAAAMGGLGGFLGGSYPTASSLAAKGQTIPLGSMPPGVSIRFGIGRTASMHIGNMLLRETFKPNLMRGVFGGLISNIPVAQ